MISLKTVFNYIKFANELTNKVSFMFNGIKKYVVRIVCVIMLLLVQFDVCAGQRIFLVGKLSFKRIA